MTENKYKLFHFRNLEDKSHAHKSSSTQRPLTDTLSQLNQNTLRKARRKDLNILSKIFYGNNSISPKNSNISKYKTSFYTTAKSKLIINESLEMSEGNKIIFSSSMKSSTTSNTQHTQERGRKSRPFSNVHKSKGFTIQSHPNEMSSKKQQYLNKISHMDDDKFEEIVKVVDRLAFEEKSGSFTSTSVMSMITINILSSYSKGGKVIGLTKIELYDTKLGIIPVCDYNTNSEYEKNLHNLFTNNPSTTDEKEMFIASLESGLKINLYYNSTVNGNNVSLGSLRIWNYNGKEINLGVKDIEIYKDDVLLWQGYLLKGCYNNKIDYSTKIKISELTPRESKTMKFFSARKSFYTSMNSINSISERNYNNYNYSYEKNALRTSIGQKSSFEINLGQNTISSVSPSSSSLINKHVIVCTRIKITFTSNYGHRKYVGITGIELLDENGEIISHKTAESIGALPKDLYTVYNDENERRIFENAFDAENITTDENKMWLTLLKHDEPFPYFEIGFPEPIRLHTIRLYNYNAEGQFDKCVRTLELLIDYHLPTPKVQEEIVLHQGIGKEVEFYQDITFPVKHFTYSENELAPFKNVKYASFLYEQCFETPYLPCGFVVGFTFKGIKKEIHPESNELMVEKIEMFDQLGRDIFIKEKKAMKILSTCQNISYSSDMSKKRNGPFKFPLSSPCDEEDKELFRLDYSNEHTKELFFIFSHPYAISYIVITNCFAKDVSIMVENNVVFEGGLNDKETLILFTCEASITKYLDEEKLSKPITKLNQRVEKNDKYISLYINNFI